MTSCKIFSSLTALVIAGTAHAQSISADNPFSVAAVLQDMGYPAEMSTDSDGDPLISTERDGIRFSVLFYGCTDGRDCKDIQLRATFETSNSISVNTINEWNRDFFIGKAYFFSDGDVAVEHPVVGLDDISRSVFERIMWRWGKALDGFTDAIDW